jgi:anti-sigma-K factor RskA
MAHEDYKEMLPALALSALDAEDARALDQHLSECAECRRELADWESTAAALALSANPAEPSAAARDRIMSAVRDEKHASRVVPFPQSRRTTWSSFGLIGAVAAAVLIVVLSLWLVVLWQQNRELRRSNRELASTIHSMDSSNRFVSILSTPGARFTALQGSGPGSGATAQLVHDRSGRAMLLANGLPPTPTGKEYQLWFIVGKNPPMPGRTFATDDLGRGALTDDVPQQAMDSAVFAVTLEPTGGSNFPSSAIYLRSGL